MYIILRPVLNNMMFKKILVIFVMFQLKMLNILIVLKWMLSYCKSFNKHVKAYRSYFICEKLPRSILLFEIK